MNDMRVYDFDERQDFKGLVPEANKSLPVVGKEIEVADVAEIMKEA